MTAALIIFIASEMMPLMFSLSQLPGSLPVGILKRLVCEETAVDCGEAAEVAWEAAALDEEAAIEGSVWYETINTMAVSGEHLHFEKSLILNTCRRLKMSIEGYESKSREQ